MNWSSLLAACLPNRCQACGEWVQRPGDWRRFAALCDGCAAALRRERGACRLGERLPLHWCFAPGPTVQRLIKGLKYSGRDGALPLLVDALRWRLDLDPPPRPWFFVPVPLPLPRRLARGFNQSELLALALRRRMDEGTLLASLARRWGAGRQAGRRRAERLERAAVEYRRHGPLPASGSLILIDDLATTGATLCACVAALGETAQGRTTALVLTRIPAPGLSLDRPNPP